MKEALDSRIDQSQYVRNYGMAARTASRIVAQASTRQKNEALLAMAQAIVAGQSRILEQTTWMLRPVNSRAWLTRCSTAWN